MSIEEKRREGFEDWASKKGLSLSRYGIYREYAFILTEKSWASWNAALDSVVIELPEEDPRGFGPGDCGDGRPSFEQQLAADCNCVLRECKQAIESAGLKVKQ